MTQLSPADVGMVVKDAGFSGSSAQQMTAIALAESGGRTDAVSKTGDYGLFQINLASHPDVTQACALDPVCAASKAFAISKQGTDFGPWTTFQQGVYQQFMAQASQGLSALLAAPPIKPSDFQFVSQPYGPSALEGFHTGIDLVTADKTPVYAITDGVVHQDLNWTVPGHPVGWAGVLSPDSSPSWSVIYGHLSQFAVPDGTHVSAGQLIGYSGGAVGEQGAGFSTGPHLHFEIDKPGGTSVDPTAFVTGLLGGHGVAAPWGGGPPTVASSSALGGSGAGGGSSSSSSDGGLLSGITDTLKNIALGGFLVLLALLIIGVGLFALFKSSEGAVEGGAV